MEVFILIVVIVVIMVIVLLVKPSELRGPAKDRPTLNQTKQAISTFKIFTNILNRPLLVFVPTIPKPPNQ